MGLFPRKKQKLPFKGIIKFALDQEEGLVQKKTESNELFFSRLDEINGDGVFIPYRLLGFGTKDCIAQRADDRFASFFHHTLTLNI